MIGRGGMGVVFAGRDVRLDRAVAVKVLPPEFAADATQAIASDEFVFREARQADLFSYGWEH